ncbi:hypothetical protein PM082_017671 [Marasmius tenuissimus]|nr:hypothetical protein PM082_017671 [Marasmius tenuissimus]
MDWTHEQAIIRLLASPNATYQVAASFSDSRGQYALKSWRKHGGIVTYVMNPPDIVVIMKVLKDRFDLRDSSYGQLKDFCQLLVQTFNIDLSRFHTIFECCTSQRDRIRAYSLAIDQYQAEVKEVLWTLPIDQLTSLLIGLTRDESEHSLLLTYTYRKWELSLHLSWPAFKSRTPAELELSIAGSREDMDERDLRSHLVFLLICQKWARQTEKLRSMMRRLSEVGFKIPTALGWDFEGECHGHILNNETLHLVPMDFTIKEKSTMLTYNPNTSVEPLFIGKRTMELYDPFSPSVTTNTSSAYYVPRFKHPLYSSFLAGINASVAFKITTPSDSQSFQWRYLQSLILRFSAVRGVQPTKLYFVSVFPKDEAFTIEIPHNETTAAFSYYALPIDFAAKKNEELDALKEKMKQDGMGAMLNELDENGFRSLLEEALDAGEMEG